MTEQNPKAAAGADRRTYFRIDDNMRLSVRRVPPGELEARLDRLEHDLAGNFTVMSSLAAITSQMAMGLRRIENRDPDLAAYLRAIDQKIEVIGRAFIAEEPEMAAQQAAPANLSAGGICAGVEELYEKGEPVEVRMLLFPSFTGLMIYGTVIECSERPEGDPGGTFRHLARISFTHIREQDRELLIRHLLRRQSAQLRGQHEGGDA